MSRFNLPFNDRVEIIWNEDGQYGTGYHDGIDDTIDGKELAGNVAVVGACAAGGVVAACTLLPLMAFISPIFLLAAIADDD